MGIILGTIIENSSFKLIKLKNLILPSKLLKRNNSLLFLSFTQQPNKKSIAYKGFEVDELWIFDFPNFLC